MSSFYIYRHIRPDTNQVFYIGKGTGYRFNQNSRRNQHWKNIVKVAGSFDAEIMISGLTEKESFLKEVEFIKIYKDAGCKLANKSDGGEGSSGVIRSDEWRRKQSEARKGRVSNRKGCKLSPETLERMRIANIGRKHSEQSKLKMRLQMVGNPHNPKKIIKISTGEIWATAKEAAKANGLNYPVLISRIRKNQEYKYLECVK